MKRTQIERWRIQEAVFRKAAQIAKGVGRNLLHAQVYGNWATGDGEREPVWEQQGANQVAKKLTWEADVLRTWIRAAKRGTK